MAQALHFNPTIEQVVSQSTPQTDYIVSGFLRASQTFKIYRTVMSVLQIPGSYLPLEIPRLNGHPDTIAFKAYTEAIRASPNVRSLVISDPYKQCARDLCDHIDARASICGAVNLIHHRDGRLHGCNIDGEAFLLGANHCLPSFAPQKGVIFGCGGVSTAVTTALASAFTQLILIDPQRERADVLQRTLLRLRADLRCEILDRPRSGDFRDFDFFYNGSGLGKESHHAGSVTATPLMDSDLFPDSGLAVDANYTPPKTKFLERLAQRGLTILNGRSHMLGFVTLHLSAVSMQNLEYARVSAIAEKV